MFYQKGVGIFIINKDKILLLKRLEEPFKDYWEVPAGKSEPGEPFRDAVVREAKEETNLIVKPIKKLGIIINPKHKFEAHLFLAEIVSGKLANNEPEKHAAIKFFNLRHLPKKIGNATKQGIGYL